MYSYDPSKIGEHGKDRMRFELGDIASDGAEFDSYLADEEIEAVIASEKTWGRAKVRLIESVCRALSYEVDTKAGPLSLAYGDRAERWRRMLEEARAEDVSIASSVAASVRGNAQGEAYFYAGMHHNERSD